MLSIRNIFFAALLIAPGQATAQEAKPADASDAVIEREFRQLLELDDKVHDEVDEWIRNNAKLAAKQVGIDPASLDLQVRNRLSEVGEAYEAFLNRHSGHVRARLAYGSFFSDINEIDKAMAQWKKARDLAPKNPVAWNNLGKAYGKQGRISRGVPALRQGRGTRAQGGAVSSQPRHADFFLSRTRRRATTSSTAAGRAQVA